MKKEQPGTSQSTPKKKAKPRPPQAREVTSYYYGPLVQTPSKAKEKQDTTTEPEQTT